MSEMCTVLVRCQSLSKLKRYDVLQAPGNADAQVAVGVLYSLMRQYDRAVAAFRAALDLQPRDYSLWNKLGATLANSSHSREAINAYQKALDLKPNYMRAWTNMGIAQVCETATVPSTSLFCHMVRKSLDHRIYAVVYT